MDNFIGYIGDYRIHDSTIQEIRSSEKKLDVLLKTMDADIITVRFLHPVRVISNKPVGMFLYAITELETEDPFRKFVFANWDEEDDAYFEVFAEDCNLLG